MKILGFSETQIAFVLKRVEDGTIIGEYLALIRLDQGSEFISRDFDWRAHTKDVTLGFFRLGTPIDNALIGSFNGKFRAGCLPISTTSAHHLICRRATSCSRTSTASRA